MCERGREGVSERGREFASEGGGILAHGRKSNRSCPYKKRRRLLPLHYMAQWVLYRLSVGVQILDLL